MLCIRLNMVYAFNYRLNFATKHNFPQGNTLILVQTSFYQAFLPGDVVLTLPPDKRLLTRDLTVKLCAIFNSGVLTIASCRAVKANLK